MVKIWVVRIWKHWLWDWFMKKPRKWSAPKRISPIHICSPSRSVETHKNIEYAIWKAKRATKKDDRNQENFLFSKDNGTCSMFSRDGIVITFTIWIVHFGSCCVFRWNRNVIVYKFDSTFILILYGHTNHTRPKQRIATTTTTKNAGKFCVTIQMATIEK